MNGSWKDKRSVDNASAIHKRLPQQEHKNLYYLPLTSKNNISAAMDLTTDQGIKSYLTTTPGLYPTCHKIDRLPEGFGGFVYRAHLGESSSSSSVIVKHVQPNAARAQAWKLDQTRLEFEYKALQLLAQAQFQAGDGGVRPPQCLHFDRDNWVLILEDAGDLPTLKSWLQPGKITTEDAQTLGRNLGHYLATIHETSTNQPALLSDFTGNETAKSLSSQLYFGMLPSAAAQHGFEGEHIQKAAEQGKADVLKGTECLTLGDFWTGNVLVSNPKELYVLDFELTKPGTPDFDIGQMAAEMYCLACFRDATRAVEGVLEGLWGGEGAGTEFGVGGEGCD